MPVRYRLGAVGSRAVVSALLGCLAACGSDSSVVEHPSELAHLDERDEILRLRAATGYSEAQLEGLNAVRTLNFCNGWAVHSMATTPVDLDTLSRVDLPRLTTLSFCATDALTDEHLEAVSRMHQVESIVLRDCAGFTPGGLAALSGLPRLRTLRLPLCDAIDDEWITTLADFDALDELEISGSSISSAGSLQLRRLLPRTVVVDRPEWWRGFRRRGEARR